MNASNFRSILFCAFLVWILPACKNEAPVTKEPPAADSKPVEIPLFNRDSAHAFVAAQVAFGPRVPGSKGHDATRKWLVQKLQSYGASVKEQSFKARTATIGDVRATNIIGSFNPSYARRVVLAAHWDTRFAADEDDTRANEPIDGADDGGSGVGALLEIARLIQQNPISLGIDIIFFDVEDQGTSNGAPDTWCLGAQYWAQNPHTGSYRAEYGILLDMVGAKGAVFMREDLTGFFPPDKAQRIHQLYNKVWALAKGMKKGALFVDEKGRPVTDDHYYVNLHTNIPMIDIIHKPLNSGSGFGPHWHTHDDNMNVIDPSVLGSVGQVVTAFVYNSSKAPM